jgi:carboxyl-terminal processing protease
MNSKVALLLTGAVIGAGGVALSEAHLPSLTAAHAAAADSYRALNLFGDVFNRVRTDYVEQPDDGALVEGAIKGMLSSLDPHSSYMNPKDYKAMQAEITGKFGGLGIEVTMENGVIKVVSPIDDTPASRAGILANDFIVKIDGEDVQGMTLGEAVDKMRGAVHSPITLTVVRKGQDNPFDVKLVREEIVVQSVKSREEGQVGYIRITQFSQQTAEGLRTAIEKIQSDIGKDKVQGYVLDLRNDPGGLLDQALEVSDDFIDSGEIVSIRGRRPDQVQSFKATGHDLVAGKPVIVLVNGGSASASEIVAGALQDHHRATVVGTRSFGKGSVQTIISLGSNGALRLTTARYFTPSGRSIQAKGIDPDVVVAEDPPPDANGTAPLRNFGEASLKGHLAAVSGGKEEAGSPAYVPTDPKQDKQLNYALDLIRGVQVNAAFPPDPTKGMPN